MKFSLDKNLTFEQAKALFFEQLGDWKIMGTCQQCKRLRYGAATSAACSTMIKIYFKTDKDFRKTKQLYENPNVALCYGGIQVEGTAKNCGLVVDEPGRVFEGLYKKHLWGSYNKYSHEDSEIIIEVTPKFVEVWDTSEDNYAYQIFIDFDKKRLR